MKARAFHLPLLLLFFCSCVTMAAIAAEPLVLQTFGDGIQRAEIIADSFFYSPDYLIVKLNVPVELTIQSKTIIIPHTFVLNDPESGLKIKQDIPAGKSVVIKFTPTRPGKFKFYCDHKLLFFKSHEERGMKGFLEVKE